MKRLRDLVTAPQGSILSAASIIMVMLVGSAVLGLLRRRILLQFFVPEDFALFEAAFRIPDFFTAIVALGTLSSAFIPTYTALSKKNKKKSLELAGSLATIGVAIYVVFLVVFFVLAEPFYRLIVPGFSPADIGQVASLSRIVFAAQGLFVVSYVLTGMLESERRFLLPALAPLLYNVGIIVGVLLFASDLGLIGAALGAALGALFHLLIQVPIAWRLGFRPVLALRLTPEIKRVARLAAPRMFELSFLQLAKVVELSLASVISTASYAYYTLAISVQTLPVSLFGTSLAKAALPALSHAHDNPKRFRDTLLTTLYQGLFLAMPFATLLIVLRIPVVRLLFGTDIFDWPATVQTGLVLSTFAIGVPFQIAQALLTRAFYALGDTRTPVKMSLIGSGITAVSGVILVFFLGFPTWALAASFVAGVAVQSTGLYILIGQRLNGGALFATRPIIKSLTASFLAGSVMFFIIKFFDRAVWIKQLSFIGTIDPNLDFQSFVVDTRFTGNLLALTVITAAIGMVVYISVSWLLKSQELATLFSILKHRSFSLPKSEPESVSPNPLDEA